MLPASDSEPSATDTLDDLTRASAAMHQLGVSLRASLQEADSLRHVVKELENSLALEKKARIGAEDVLRNERVEARERMAREEKKTKARMAEDALRNERVDLEARERTAREEEENTARMAAEDALRNQRVSLEVRERKILEDEGKIRLAEDITRTVLMSQEGTHGRLSEPPSTRNGSRIEDHGTSAPSLPDSPSAESPRSRKRTRVDSGSSDNLVQSSGNPSLATSSTRTLRHKAAPAAGSATAESLVNPTTPRHSSLFTPAPSSSTNDVDMDGGVPRGRRRRGRPPTKNAGQPNRKQDGLKRDKKKIEAPLVTETDVSELGHLELPEGQERFEPGTLVWAKSKSFPWWPATIIEDAEDGDTSIPIKDVKAAKAQRKDWHGKGPLHMVRFYGEIPSW
ncbi:hypothetical protein C8R44DRAFT_331321 [Mycena epipterygia]|nr:hypothetical protein C8R44DRAFT_331321 [Mycena epipterygia]